MRIAILASGRSYHATRWASGLSERGLKVGFFTIHSVERPLASDIDVFSLGSGSKADYLLSANRVRASLKQWKPDLIHCHYATGYGLLGKLSGQKNRIVSLYGSDVFDFPFKSYIHKKLLYYIIHGASAVLSTSHVMADKFHKIYPDLSMPVVTPFGVDINKFVPVNNIADGAVINIGIVKKMERKYGVDVLIDAFSEVIKTNPKYDWRLNIVGEGSQRMALEEQVRILGLQSNINFIGAIQNNRVPGFLAKQNVFIVPSRDESESFGVAAVEAQACGLPVIASDVGGLPEVISDGETGFIIPKENKDALAQAIEKICLNDELRQNMSVAARENAVRKYNWSNNLDQMIEIYTNNCKRSV